MYIILYGEKMKKLLATLFAALSLTAAQASETITVFYAWGPGDSVANYHRTIANEANKIQDKYNFIFDTKPGAGGAIATNHVLGTPNAILAHSTAFFVRPVVYPNESYDLTKFKEQYVHCMAPMAITSTKYKTWKDVPADAKVSVGISGLGVTTHLAAIEMQKRFSNLNIIPFKSTNDSMLSMVSGQTDFHIGFISEAEQWSKENARADRKVSVLGITGSKVVNGYTPLAKQGFDASFADMNVGHHMLVPTTVDAAKHKEFHEIFARAAKTDAVRAAYAVDYCEPQSVAFDGLTKFFTFHTNYWKKLASAVKL
jgi:tripartite-type tricarboxylate transporter receptor subunit TctC